MRRGHPVGAPATSNDGGDISADALAGHPAQVRFALRPAGIMTNPFQVGLDDASLPLPVPSGFFNVGHVPDDVPMSGRAMPATIIRV
jgi:hypothetical protein